MEMHWFFRKIANWPKKLGLKRTLFFEINQYLGGDFRLLA
jgi:hypothetical protein